MLNIEYSPKMEFDMAVDIVERIKFGLRYPDERDAIDTILAFAQRTAAMDELNEMQGDDGEPEGFYDAGYAESPSYFGREQ